MTLRRISKITAVDQPNNKTPFIAVIGPSMGSLVARYGLAVHPGNREQWISILHVQDLAGAVVRAAETDEAVGRVYADLQRDIDKWAKVVQVSGAKVQ